MWLCELGERGQGDSDNAGGSTPVPLAQGEWEKG